MFGYLTPDRDELLVREDRVYRAHYCGVCFGLRKCCGLRSCLSLTYDSAFLSLLGTSLGNGVRPQPTRCPFKPYKRIYAAKSKWTDYAANVNALMSVKKCEDDRRDEHRIRGTAGEIFFKKAGRRATAALPVETVKAVTEAMASLDALERDMCDRLDEPALAFGRVMEAVISGIPDGGRYKAALGWMGLNLGRWLYLIDAWDDLEKDAKSGSYNVILNKFGSVQAAAAQRERMEFNMIGSLYQAGKAAELLPEGGLSPIIKNIVGTGAAERTRRALEKYGDKTDIAGNCCEKDSCKTLNDKGSEYESI